ncbi:uncharacterized protein EI90DRAFT_3152532 [Cantharellus anzutake]|uniref:uncharacterized protein n=1 Tax=Cantharellus anzutake TaxID=1750568 RepID=UPI00190586A3|nr:uncharacterized protein EI90DRAFT_3152532 [Cantharellus anzutake]KAF8336328.1 hypothetical protein EI90DRAFT_3152532 [Cantharellus anzutake]
MCSINPNPDVSGIGIRLSVYITSTIIALIPRIPETEELRKSLTQGAGLNGVALLLTAVVQTGSNSLDLYHAIIIIHMLGFLGLATYPAGSYRATPARLVVFWISTWAVYATYLAWVTYIWVKAPTFGSRPECNSSTVYVVFFRGVRATVPWLRWLAVTFAGLGMILLLRIAAIPVITFSPGRKHSQRAPRVNTLQQYTPPPRITQVPGDSHDPTPIPLHVVRSSSLGLRPPSMATAAAEDMTHIEHILSREPKYGIFTRTLATVYGIVMLERTIASNDVGPGENVWSFGQFVAITIVIGSVNEVVHYCLHLRGYGYKEMTIGEYIEGVPKSSPVNDGPPNESPV